MKSAALACTVLLAAWGFAGAAGVGTLAQVLAQARPAEQPTARDVTQDCLDYSVHPPVAGTCPDYTLHPPTVGPLRGFVKTTRGGEKVVAFLGLPYAQNAPRFEPSPGLAPVWTVERDARVRAPTCPQGKFYPSDLDSEGPGSPNGDKPSPAYTFGDTPMERDARNGEAEDCLTLDIYAPLKALESLAAGQAVALPVLFWVHGGAFVRGSSISARPDFLLDHADVVIVAPQYRLGPLGFLVAGGKKGGKGNQALWDQKMALEWTRRNVASFGGNPSNIIIGGVSAGGATSGLLYVSPESTNYVNAAILCSGVALSPWTVDPNPRAATKRLAYHTGECREQALALAAAEEAEAKGQILYEDRMEVEEKLRVCLNNIDVELLLNATFDYALEEKYHGRAGMGATIPVVDGEGGFLPVSPQELLDDESFAGRPLLIGVTRDEGVYLFVQVHYFYMMRRQLLGDENLLRHGMGDLLLRFAGLEDHLHVLGNGVNKLYWRDDQLGDYPAMEDGMIDFTGAGFFKGPAHQMALRNTARGGNSWLYTFDYSGKHVRDVARVNESTPRANHGHDQAFLFPSRDAEYQYHDEDWEMVDKFSHMVANFITQLDPRDPPSSSGERLIHGQRWEPMKGIDGAYMRIHSSWERRTHWSSEFHATNNEALRLAVPSPVAALVFALVAALAGARAR